MSKNEDKNSSTSSLVTSDFSDQSDTTRKSFTVIDPPISKTNQTELRTNSIVRMGTVHREKDLVEFNHGIIFKDLMTNPEMKRRFSKLLNDDRKKLESYITTGR